MSKDYNILYMLDNPTVDIAILNGAWVPNSNTIYISKSTNLRRRIRELIRFGYGQNSPHWCDRYIWQIAGWEQFIAAFKEDDAPRNAEIEHLNEFRQRFGKYPFANLL